MKYITAIDLGSQTIKGVIAKNGGKEAQILATAEVPADGVRRGVIVNIEEAANSVAKVLDTLFQISGIRPRDVYVGFGDPQIAVRETKGTIIVSRADQEISEEDVIRAFQAAETINIPQNKEVVHIIPREYVVDGEGGIKDPVGMKGLKLEVNALLIEGFGPFIKNLNKAVELCGVEIAGLVFYPLASARAVLSKRQRELGALVIDIGGTTTGIAVYEDGEVTHAQVLPIGSSHITNDVAIHFKLQIDLAEKIKIEYGASMPTSISKKEILNLEELGINVPGISRKALAAIINRRMKEIFKTVLKELKKFNKNIKFPGGVVITGGGAKIPLVVDLIKKEFKLPAQIGFPEGADGLTSAMDDPRLATLVGLVEWGIEMKGGSYRRGIFSGTLRSGPGMFLKKVIKNILP